MRDITGRTGSVEDTLGVPPGPWAAKGSEPALGRLAIRWDDGERANMVKASLVIKTKQANRVAP